MAMEQFKISAKNLGVINMPEFCPRCFWIRLKTANKLPWQSFPGIFSTIDAYTKNCVHRIIDEVQKTEELYLPDWLKEIGDIVGYEKVPHWSKTLYHDKKTNIILSGAPDDIFIRNTKKGRDFPIPDYKTAKFTENADRLMPIYQVQMIVYGILVGTSDSDLYLIYMEPQTDKKIIPGHIRGGKGFSMDFVAHVLQLENDRSVVREALNTARGIYEMEKAPEMMPGCKECLLLEGVLENLER